MLRFLPLFATVLLPVIAAGAIVPAVDFSHDIVPILREHCAACHTGDKKKGGFSMDSRANLIAGGENGRVIEAGRSAESKLIKAILSTDPDEQMPPPDAKQKRVPAEKIALLKAWIDSGVAWEDGFTFRKPAYEPPLKPRVVALPPAKGARTNPIDRILDAYLAQHAKPPPPRVDDAAFARRVHLDLIGLLPEPEDLARFMGDPAPDKRARLVQSLLTRDTDYTEHWISFWNDLLRNDYAIAGFGPASGSPITRWLYDALLNNKPYDAMVRELIAPPTPDSAGFSTGLTWRGTVSASQTREAQFAQSISQAFLGINMKCASCHDSFVDRWKLTDAYGLAAIYANRPLQITRCDKATDKVAHPAWIFPELGQIQAEAPQTERLKQLAALMTHPDNGRFTRTVVNRLWHRLMGRGIVHPVDAMQTEPWNADLLDFLASDFFANGCDLKKTFALICTSEAYQSRVVVRQRDDNAGVYVFEGPRARRMTAEQFLDAVWQLTGSQPAASDAPVLRGRPDARLVSDTQLTAQWIWEGAELKEKPTNATEAASPEPVSPPVKKERTKLVLRKTITLEDTPETARGVLGQESAGVRCYVNGTALQNDKQLIGTQGLVAVDFKGALRKGPNEIVFVVNRPPSTEPAPGVFFEARCRMKQGTAVLRTDDTWEWSPDLRDLKTKVTVSDAASARWLPVVAVPVQPRQEALRPVITETMAHLLMPAPPVRASLMKCDLLQRALGRPNREQIVSMRPEELTTLEALDLANGATLAEAFARGAKRLVARTWASPDALTTWLYRFAVSRQPSPDELSSARELLGPSANEQGVQDLLWTVCMLPEFQLIR